MQTLATSTISNKDIAAKAVAMKTDLELAHIGWAMQRVEAFTEAIKGEGGLRLELVTNNMPDTAICDICGNESQQDIVFARMAEINIDQGFVCTDCVKTFEPEFARKFATELDGAYRELAEHDSPLVSGERF
ncbi:MAG: hypothetical protein ISS70_08155 [Phycisphaerae bacterium]|nr:hypothetical protein [Phycisphaerae bacterium]